MKYSIITINYNNKDGLKKTIESVINQSYRNFEYIIIDGGSTDGSVDIIKEYEKHINYWVSEPDKGVYNAMNKGIMKAHGDYLNFMNSGDCFYSSQTLERISLIPNVDIIMGKSFISSNIIVSPHYPVTLYSICVYGINHQAVFYKKSFCTKYLYDESLKYVSDFKLTIQCLIVDNCSYEITNEIIAIYDTTGISSCNPTEVDKERDIVLKQLFPHRLADDLAFFRQLRSPLLSDIKYISKTYLFHKFIYKIVHTAVVIKKKLDIKRKK